MLQNNENDHHSNAGEGTSGTQPQPSTSRQSTDNVNCQRKERYWSQCLQNSTSSSEDESWEMCEEFKDEDCLCRLVKRADLNCLLIFDDDKQVLRPDSLGSSSTFSEGSSDFELVDKNFDRTIRPPSKDFDRTIRRPSPLIPTVSRPITDVVSWVRASTPNPERRYPEYMLEEQFEPSWYFDVRASRKHSQHYQQNENSGLQPRKPHWSDVPLAKWGMKLMEDPDIVMPTMSSFGLRSNQYELARVRDSVNEFFKKHFQEAQDVQSHYQNKTTTEMESTDSEAKREDEDETTQKWYKLF